MVCTSIQSLVATKPPSVCLILVFCTEEVLPSGHVNKQLSEIASPGASASLSTDGWKNSSRLFHTAGSPEALLVV